jgi:hypothetical protein
MLPSCWSRLECRKALNNRVQRLFGCSYSEKRTPDVDCERASSRLRSIVGYILVAIVGYLYA